MDEDTKENGSFFIWALLELAVELDDECGGHGGK